MNTHYTFSFFIISTLVERLKHSIFDTNGAQLLILLLVHWNVQRNNINFLDDNLHLYNFITCKLAEAAEIRLQGVKKVNVAIFMRETKMKISWKRVFLGNDFSFRSFSASMRVFFGYDSGINNTLSTLWITMEAVYY